MSTGPADDNIQPVTGADDADLRRELHAYADQTGRDHAAVERFLAKRRRVSGLIPPSIDELPGDIRIVEAALAADLSLTGLVFVDYAVDPAKFEVAFLLAEMDPDVELTRRGNYARLVFRQAGLHQVPAGPAANNTSFTSMIDIPGKELLN